MLVLTERKTIKIETYWNVNILEKATRYNVKGLK